MMLPALMAPFLETVMNLHQLTIADMKGWSHKWVTGGYAIFAIRRSFSMFAGRLVSGSARASCPSASRR